MVQIFQSFGVSVLLWGAAITALLLGGFAYYIRGKEKEDNDEKNIMMGFAGLLSCLGISKIFFILGPLMNYELFYVQNSLIISDDILAYNIFVLILKAHFVFTILGILILIYPIEKKFQKTKYIFTICNLVFLFLIIIGTHGFTAYFYDYAQYFNIFLVYFILIRLVKYAEYEFKAIISLLLIGFMLILSGFLLYNVTLFNLHENFYLLPPILVIVGSLITITPIIINPVNHSNIQKYWLFFGIIPIALGVSIMIIFLIFIELLSIAIILNTLIIMVFLFFTFYQIIILIKNQQEPLTKIPINILDLFTKPPSLSKEDLLFNKEKHLCLVCKNQIIGYTYICPSCKALYCPKCSKSLTDLENSCWVCSSPIDKSKPVREIKDGNEMRDGPKGSKKMVKFYSDKKMLKHIFDEKLSPTEMKKLELIKLTIITEEELDEIEKFGLDDKDHDDFIKEVLNFPLNERKLILKDIYDQLNKGEKQN